MKYKDFCRYGGGRAIYIFHVAGYPWILTTGEFNTTSYADLAKLIVGFRKTGTSSSPYNYAEFVHGALQAPDRIKYTLDDNTGLIEGGRYSLKVHKQWTGIDWTEWGFPSSYSGLPGLDFLPEIGASGSFGWGYLSGSLANDAETITYMDQNYNVLSDRVAGQATSFVWVGNECIQVDDAGVSGSDKTLSVRNESGSGISNGRGCFRTKSQSHRSEEYTGATPIVSSVPLGSIAGKACYLWMTVVDGDHNVILDEGAFCVSHGRVQPHVKIGADEIDVPVEPWLNHLKQDIPIATFSASMAGYVFTRGEALDPAPAIEYCQQGVDGTGYGNSITGGGMRKSSSCPHLGITWWNTVEKRFETYGVWLCGRGETVFFKTAEDVILALQTELQLCNTGDPAQKSGEQLKVNSIFYQYLDFNTISGEKYRIQKSSDDPDRWIIKHVYIWDPGSGGTPSTLTTKFSGPLAVLFNLCNVTDENSGPIKEALADGDPIDTLGADGLPTIYMQPGDGKYEFSGSLLSYPTRSVHPLGGGITPYFIQNYKLSERIECYAIDDNMSRYRLGQWPIPIVDTNPRIFLEEDTDMSQIGADGDFIQFGSYKDEDLDEGKAARSFIGNVTDTGEYQGLPYLEFDSTTNYKWEYQGADNPALAASDLNRPLVCRVHHALYWMPGLAPESDPWRVTSKEVTVSSTSIVEIFQALLGFDVGTELPIPDIGRIDWMPDVNDPDCIDEIPSIDWESFETAMQPIVSGQYYSTTLETGKVNIYEMLKGELQFHGVTMVLEPYTSGVGGNWIIRFRKKTEINTTNAQSEGRLIDSSNVMANDTQKAEHNKDWRFSQIDVQANRIGEEYRFNFSAASQFARARIGGTAIQKIDAGLSHLPLSLSTAKASTSATDLHAHFIPLLVRSSKDKPIITKQLTSKSLFYINLGRDALLTDEVTYNINSGERGLDMAPCRVVGVEHILGNKDYGVNVDLAMGTNATTTYGWAPAMTCSGTNTEVLTTGTSGTVTLAPDEHSFTPTDGRTDLSYFRNQIYNPSIADYEVDDSDPAFAVLVMSVNDADWTPVQGTISGMSTDCTTAVLTVDTSEFTIVSDAIVEDLWIKFDTWDNVEPEQQRFLCLANEQNQINLQSVASDEASLGTYSGGAPSQVIWANETWFGFGGYGGGVITRWDGGTTWTAIRNTISTSGSSYQNGVLYYGEIWSGSSDHPSGGNPGVCSYDPESETWTSRDSGARQILDICLYADTVAIVVIENNDGTNNPMVYYWSSDTTWIFMGVVNPQTPTNMQILEADDELYVVEDVVEDVYKYSGGTTWVALSCPFTPTRMTEWNGRLVVAGTSATNKAVVYQYQYNVWTQLGDDLSTDSCSSFKFLSQNLNKDLYAMPELSGGDSWYKYSTAENEWSAYLASSYVGIQAGEFNKLGTAVGGDSFGGPAVEFSPATYSSENAIDGHRWQI